MTFENVTQPITQGQAPCTPDAKKLARFFLRYGFYPHDFMAVIIKNIFRRDMVRCGTERYRRRRVTAILPANTNGFLNVLAISLRYAER